MSVINRISDAFSHEEQHPGPYMCQNCDRHFTLQYQVCPKCGGYAIERVDWSELLAVE